MTMETSEGTVRRCFAVDLVNDPDMIARYEAWHAAGGPPAAITAAIRADDVRSLRSGGSATACS